MQLPLWADLGEAAPCALPCPPTVGDILRGQREELGLTVRSLARSIGRPHTIVSRWERGLREPTLLDLHRVCGALGLSVDAVFSLAAHPRAGRRWSSRAHSEAARRRVGSALALARRSRGLLPSDVRRFGGIPAQRLLAIEAGADPSLAELWRLRELLHLDLDGVARIDRPEPGHDGRRPRGVVSS